MPARVLHKWDFTPQPVCCAAADYLASIYEQPVLCVAAINPGLYTRYWGGCSGCMVYDPYNSHDLGLSPLAPSTHCLCKQWCGRIMWGSGVLNMINDH